MISIMAILNFLCSWSNRKIFFLNLEVHKVDLLCFVDSIWIFYILQLLSPNNVATYGALCALASFDRSELQKNVIGSSSFKLFLELEPQLRDILHKFYESKYASCLRLLGEIKVGIICWSMIRPYDNCLYIVVMSRPPCIV